DEIFGGIERLTGPKQFAAEAGREQARTRPGGAVQDEHGLAGRVTQRGVMEAELGCYFAGVEGEVAGNPAGFPRCGRLRERRGTEKHQYTQDQPGARQATVTAHERPHRHIELLAPEPTHPAPYLRPITEATGAARPCRWHWRQAMLSSLRP